jgi:hypothetical protein
MLATSGAPLMSRGFLTATKRSFAVIVGSFVVFPAPGQATV